MPVAMRHPLHPALVHFPIACWSLASAADLASLYWGEPAWQLAGMLLVIGTIMAIAAMGSGFVELLKVGPQHPANADLNRHMLLVMIAWCLYATSLYLRSDGIRLVAPDPLAISLSIVAFVVLVAAGWFGGQLVYRHGLGRN
jgi:uncharacterized membrane protein